MMNVSIQGGMDSGLEKRWQKIFNLALILWALYTSHTFTVVKRLHSGWLHEERGGFVLEVGLCSYRTRFLSGVLIILPSSRDHAED